MYLKPAFNPILNYFQGFPDVDGERQHGGRFPQEFANVRQQARLSTVGLERRQREQQEELVGVRHGLLGECYILMTFISCTW